MYISDHQEGDLSDIIRSANLTIQSETDHDRWKFPEDSEASFQHLPTNGFDTNSSIKDSLLHGGNQMLVDQKTLSVGDDSMRTPNNNIISRVFQLSSPVKQSELVLGQGDTISSPYISGVKRRKSLPRKVVCIPAAGNTNTSSGRATSGEVVPCDLWAWRKYGQKPIKGSPYPRGYYRCSSSKGCAARKQVERSRTDPKMLVITYTSEHNHPWPTQRNALAGSTRSSYPSKHPKPPPSTNSSSKDTNKTSTTASTSGSTSIREEASETMNGANEVLHDTCMENDDLFANLAELENDPVSLLFEKSDVKNNGKNCKDIDDTFDDIFDWEQSSFVDHS